MKAKKMGSDLYNVLEKHALWLSSDGSEGSRANLAYENLEGENLEGVNLKSVNLAYANLERANLTHANLEGANLHSANLAYANLHCANLKGANIHRGNLEGASFEYANLEYANLDGASLDGTSGDMIHLKSVFCETYPVTYTSKVMQIGCQRHNIEDWWTFDDGRILEMDGDKALKWWRKWKPILQQIIAVSPAATTKHKYTKVLEV